jgi:hypothetical protein
LPSLILLVGVALQPTGVSAAGHTSKPDPQIITVYVTRTGEGAAAATVNRKTAALDRMLVIGCRSGVLRIG